MFRKVKLLKDLPETKIAVLNNYFLTCIRADAVIGSWSFPFVPLNIRIPFKDARICCLLHFKVYAKILAYTPVPNEGQRLCICTELSDAEAWRYI